MHVIEWISWFALGTFGTAAVISLRSFRNHLSADLKWLSLLWVFLFCLDVIGNVLKEKNFNNLWLYNIFGWFFYLPLCALYYTKLHQPAIRTFIKIFAAILATLIVVDTFFIEGFRRLQSLVIVVGGAGIICLAGAYFRQLYVSDSSEKISRDPWFWFSFAFIIYFGASVPYLGMLNYLWEHYKDFAAAYYFYVNISFTIVLHCLIITGYLCRINFQKSS